MMRGSFGTARNQGSPLRPDMQMRRPNPGTVTETDVLNELNPVMADDNEAYQAQPEGFLPVRVMGPVQTQAMPTVAAGSRTITLSAAGISVLVGSADPRRASLTVVTNQPTYIGSSKAQTDQGLAGLCPANVGLVFTHRQEIYVSGAAANTYPMTVAVWQENWAY